ncbi:MAG: DNA mismatch repair protein [Bacteroidales bacterium]|nr:DNA mismatch repair protein [Bacteroidales bacterium]MDD3990175.1 DNA mismatch repair protein [Bacteroidales bacterium]
MKFEIDKQTLEDLNLLGKYKSNSIFSLFNHTVTRGGEMLLERMFLNPFTEADPINKRSSIINLFQKNSFSFPFTREEFDITEHYLGNPDHKNIVISLIHNIRRKALQLIANDKESGLLQQGLMNTVCFVKKLEKHLVKMEQTPEMESNPYRESLSRALATLRHKRLSWIYALNEEKNIPFLKTALYDHRLRYTLSGAMSDLMEIIHEMDLFVTVSSIGRKRGFVYASANEDKSMEIDIKGVYHPCIPNAVANDIHIDSRSNVLFLTGANMAGKSTLMKSFGVSLYLAHMGFPVAAEAITFSVHRGLYTSINVPDDLNMGYSHFYAEVVRVKKIATEVASGKNLVVMFDELFKGTNVKDAYDATVAITDAFSDIRECAFIVSTHIMEAGVTLRENHKNIQFKYLPTIMKGNTPVYTYTLDDGISDDRHGMRIINNEKIIETINKNGTVHYFV